MQIILEGRVWDLIEFIEAYKYLGEGL